MLKIKTIAVMILGCASLAPLTGCDDDMRADELEADENLAEELEDDAIAQAVLADDEVDDGEAAPVDAIETIRMETKPNAIYSDCPPWANFCFWTGAWYTGTMTAYTNGDFYAVFQAPVNSMLKRNGTHRVKVFGNGSCKVVGPYGSAVYEPVLPFPVAVAKRLENGAPGC